MPTYDSSAAVMDAGDHRPVASPPFPVGVVGDGLLRDRRDVVCRETMQPAAEQHELTVPVVGRQTGRDVRRCRLVREAGSETRYFDIDALVPVTDALDFVERFYNDALMNGLTLDRHKEEKAVELFAKNIMRAGEMFLSNPMETPFIPSWTRVNSALPDLAEEFVDAVKQDHLYYCR